MACLSSTKRCVNPQHKEYPPDSKSDGHNISIIREFDTSKVEKVV